MLKLDKHIKIDKEVIESQNLCDRFSTEDLVRIGAWASEGYERDEFSREKWKKRMSAAMDLALQIVKDKNFPWPNCANVAFPLVTIAALQFHARAYPTLVSGTDLVKARVIGEDPKGEKKARAERISCHMSYQLLEQDRAWEEQHDRMLINLPIVGCAFKKSQYSASRLHNISELVLAQDLVMNYWAKSVESCARKTHVIPFYRNEIHERVMRGTFRDVLKENWYQGLPTIQLTPEQIEANRRKGVQPPPQADETTPFSFLEQHVSADFDGDGYAEPYILTLEKDSKCVTRIVTRFDREEDVERDARKRIIKIHPIEYFTKYSFIPSPDGGVYDLGFGLFLGPLNESVNTLVDQLLDAGTWSVTAGGFLGRGAKIRGGVYTFAPLEWKRVDATGDDLRKSIVPLEAREPSAVLFQLLVLLINYTNRISGSTDLMVGENVGQNTPAQTADTMLEQGQKIYNSIFKRVWRGSKEEFKKLYQLNAIYLPTSKVNYGTGKYVMREDYLGDPEDVCPAADPNVTSDTQIVQQAMAIKQAAMTTPGYNRDEVERQFLKAMKVSSIDALFPGTAGTEPPKDPKIVVAEMRAQTEAAKLQQASLEFVLSLREEQRMNNVEIIKLQAEAQARLEEVEGDKEDRIVALINAQLGMAKQRNEAILKQIDVLIKGFDLEKARVESGAMAGMAAAPGNGNAALGGNGAAGGPEGAMGLGSLQ